MLQQTGGPRSCNQHLTRRASAASFFKPIQRAYGLSPVYKPRTAAKVCQRHSIVARSSGNAPTVDSLPTTNERLMSQHEDTAQPIHVDALIIGGGPAGLSAALMLARRGYRVTVAERHAQVSYSDPDRSYVYAIDGRGRQFTDDYGLTPTLAELGVDTLAVNVTRVYPDGKSQSKRQVIKDEQRVVYWLPRDSFMRMLESATHQQPASSHITTSTNTEAVAIRRRPSGSSSSGGGSSSGYQIEVTLRNTVTGSTQTFVPKLLVGCDGINSLVRTSLQSWAGEQSPATSSSSSRFSMHLSPSLSTNLRFKVLQLPPNPAMKDGTVLNNPDFCLLVGKKSELIGGAALRFGVLPIKNPTAGRTANLITLPDHPVWDVSDAETMYRVLEEAVPQAEWRQLVPESVMAKFAASRGGQFPAPQYSRGLSMVISADTPGTSSGSSGSSSEPPGAAAAAAAVKGCGVVLLGDAAHCFPPDLGQGVNSALEDVCVLEQQLAAARDDLAAALPAFEQQRLPDAAALAKLVQIGFPLQYNQYPLRRVFWNIGFMAQAIIHKILPFLISPPLFLMIQDPKMSYSRILEATERSRKLVLVLGAVFAAAAAWLLRRLVAQI